MNVSELRDKLVRDYAAAIGRFLHVQHLRMAYILDSFAIVRERDIAKHGSYRTKVSILELYDEYASGRGATTTTP